MRRIWPLLGGIAASGVFLLAIGGAEAGTGGGLFAIVAAAGVVWALYGWVQRRRPALPGGWTPPAKVVFSPAAGPRASSPRRVAAALGRVEARELASSASVGVGLGLSLMLLVLFGLVWAGDYGGDVVSYVELFPIFVHPLAGLLVLAAHRARTRSSRDGTQELYESCPTTEATRTQGHLRTWWVGAVTAGVFLALLTAAVVGRSSFVYGDPGARQLAVFGGAVLLAAGAVALGVCVARWAPWTPAAVLAVVAVGVASVRLATSGERTTHPIRQLSTWLNEPEVSVHLTAPSWAAHLLWIFALTGLVITLALLRDHPAPRLLAAAALVLALATVAGITATRPMAAADAARIAAIVNEPMVSQDCSDVSGLLVCAYPPDRALRDHFRTELAPVADAVPEGSLDGWALRQGAELDRDQLDPAVQRRLTDAPAGPRAIPFEPSAHRHADQGARIWVGLTATGVVDGLAPGATRSLAGRARGVVALWLATRGADADTTVAMTSFDPDSTDGDTSYGRPWPNPCYAGPSPVVWAVTDIAAARLLVELPDARVRDVIEDRWELLTDPATTTDELMGLFGFDHQSDLARRTRSSSC